MESAGREILHELDHPKYDEYHKKSKALIEEESIIENKIGAIRREKGLPEGTEYEDIDAELAAQFRENMKKQDELSSEFENIK